MDGACPEEEASAHGRADIFDSTDVFNGFLGGVFSRSPVNDKGQRHSET